MILHLFLLLFQWQTKQISAETVSGCTINNNNNRRINTDKTSVTLSCANNGYILVRNLTFGVHKTPSVTTAPSACSYQLGDCTTRTTYIGMECNGLTTCDLDLNPQYLHICKSTLFCMSLHPYSHSRGNSTRWYVPNSFDRGLRARKKVTAVFLIFLAEKSKHKFFQWNYVKWQKIGWIKINNVSVFILCEKLL